MAEALIRCPHCKKQKPREVGAINRARNDGYAIYCSRRCSGLARRTKKPPKRIRKALKAAYDARRRVELRDEIRAEKAEYHQRTYDPVKARRVRRKRREWHTEYCRRYYADPKRRAAKVRYDERRRAELLFGRTYWADCHRLLVRLQNEIRRREPRWYERAKARGYYENLRTTKERKRDVKISGW